MGSVALEGENKGNMLIMKVLEESKQFQVGSVVTRNPIYGWTKRKDGWPAVSDIPVAKFPQCHSPQIPSQIHQFHGARHYLGFSKGRIGIIPAFKTPSISCWSWELVIFCSTTPGWKNFCFSLGMNPFRSG